MYNDENKVYVFSKYNCMQCKFAKLFLDNNNIEYVEINIEEDEEALVHIKENYQAKAMPLVVFNQEVYARGNNPDGLERLAEVIS